MSPTQPRLLYLFLILAVSGWTSGCSSWRPWRAADRPWTADTFRRAEAARLELVGGGTVELVEPELIETGARPRISGREATSAPGSAPRVVELEQVLGVQVRMLDDDRMVGNVLAGGAFVLVVLMIAGLVFIAINGVPVMG